METDIDCIIYQKLIEIQLVCDSKSNSKQDPYPLHLADSSNSPLRDNTTSDVNKEHFTTVLQIPYSNYSTDEKTEVLRD